jgi:hypothetical protein
VAARLGDAAAQGRMGETLLLTAHLLRAGPGAGDPYGAVLAVESLRSTGLEGEARALAAEAVAALLPP